MGKGPIQLRKNWGGGNFGCAAAVVLRFIEGGSNVVS
jgi:hypothetical protein